MRDDYVSALTATLRHEDPEQYWSRFRELFARAYVLANLIGRMEVQNSLKGTRKYAQSLMLAPWEKAIEIFLGKIPTAKSLLDLLIPEARAKAFYVTGIEQVEALSKIQQRVVKTLAAEPGESRHQLQAEAAEDLSLARLETVLRTNTMTALNEGAMDEAKSLGDSVALLELNEVHDRRTRGNPNGLYPHEGKHFQMDGFVESPDNPVWNTIRPPAGFNCRGYTSVIGWVKAERMGLADADTRRLKRSAIDAHNGKRWDYIRSGQYPDPGFQVA